jgi:beta-lactam-binding protein with PASTA domain/Flp pilus assembly protein TadD
MGRLDEAETALKRTLAIDPMRARSLNTLGNVYLDRAKAAKEKNNFTLAKDYLDRASAAYTKAARRPGEQHHRQPSQSSANQVNVQTVVQSNLGQVHLKLGEMARQQGNAPEALVQYRTATRTFQDAAALDHDNPFAFAGIGDAYRESAEVFISRNEKANADQYFAMSKDHYVQAAKLHGDMSEAYVGLGRIADDTGHRLDAIKYFARAAALRPEQPEPHYYLAVAYAGVDPEKADEEARKYLRVERPVFNQGRQANNATRIKEGLPPENLTPQPKPTEGPQPPVIVVGPPVTPPTTIKLKVKVPGLKGDDPKKALQELRQKGFDPRQEDVAECNATGRVLYSTPAKNAEVDSGSVVTIYVSSPGPNAVPIPRVTGLMRSRAEDELRRANLRARIAGTEPTNSSAPDTVMSQKPDERSKLSMPGCEIALTLAIPIPKVRVPSFVTLSREQALSQLPRFSFGGGLVRGNISAVENCDYNGIVIEQRPQAGEMVNQGTSVDLVIGKCTRVDDVGPGPQQPDYVDVPDLIGKSRDEAYNIVKHLGLSIQVMEGNPTYGAYKQYPTPGPRKALRGSAIQLWFPSIGD